MYFLSMNNSTIHAAYSYIAMRTNKKTRHYQSAGFSHLLCGKLYYIRKSKESLEINLLKKNLEVLS